METGPADKVLLVDDEPNALMVYAGLLREWGLSVVTAGGTLEAMEIIGADPGITLAVVDLRMPAPDGMALFRWIRANHAELPVVILTAFGSVGSAVEAMSEGAFHYLAKPPEPEQFRSIIGKAGSHVAMTREIRRLKERLLEAGGDQGEVVGGSPAFRRVLKLVAAVADSEAPVLILGDTGTGKEMIARLVHGGSRRAAGPFVGLNCGALPPNLLESELFGHEKGAFTGALASRRGRFEEADGGTMFLDEVGDCSPEMQVKLLRVLEEKKFCRLGTNRDQVSDFRLVGATNRDLGEAVREGRFREDLLFRLNVFEIQLPPLKDRIEDVPALAAHFLRKSAAKEGRRAEGLTPGAMDRLMSYPWPGNVRELENVIHRAVILAGERPVSAEHLPARLQGESGVPAGWPGPFGGCPVQQKLSDWERVFIRATLARCGGNKSRAARVLGISRKVLYAKLGRAAPA